MEKSIKIARIVFAFVYLVIFDYVYLFICLLGLIPIILLIVGYSFIVSKILKGFTHTVAILILSIVLFLHLFYISFFELLLINIGIGIIYLFSHFKTLKK